MNEKVAEQIEEPRNTKRRKYQTQNDKVWTINFSKLKFVQKAKIIVPALKEAVSLESMGLTIMLAVEYCLQEHIMKDFHNFVDNKRRSLYNS